MPSGLTVPAGRKRLGDREHDPSAYAGNERNFTSKFQVPIPALIYAAPFALRSAIQAVT